MKTILFHNELAARYPDGIQVEGNSAIECLTALTQFEGLRHEDGVSYQVTLPDFQSRDALYDNTSKNEIHVYAANHALLQGAGGGGGGGFFAIAIGVLLIAVAPYLSPALIAAGMTGATIGAITTVGAMMVLQGLVQVLSPAPNSNDGQVTDSQDQSSAYLSADKNTTKAGTRIALILGRAKVYGHILSFQVSATNMFDPLAVQQEQFDGGLTGNGDGSYNLATYEDWGIV